VIAPDIAALRQAFSSGELKPSEHMAMTLARAARVNEQCNAFVRLCPERAMSEAKAADRAYLEGQPQSLTGVPIAIKDNILVEGLQITCGSNILHGFTAPYSATAVERLLHAGAIPVAITNCDEFAMGSSNETSAYGPVRNPHHPEYVPGGSSGGSAAAVAAGAVLCALGSDTGGSVRQPAAFCGVAGIKPTYGRVSRFGLVAFASSLDQIGPIGATVRDAAEVLTVIAGYDPRDSTSARTPCEDFTAHLGQSAQGIRVGMPTEYLDPDVCGNEVLTAIHHAASMLRCHGARIVEISLPLTKYAIATYQLIATAEASSNLARFDGIRYGARSYGADALNTIIRSRTAGFGSEVKRRIMLGTFALSAGYLDAYYQTALRVRALFQQEFRQAFSRCDALLTPVSPTPPFKLGERAHDPLQMYHSDLFTVAANLTGCPALSVPAGQTDSPRLPLAAQLIGPHFSEALLLRLGQIIEQATG